MNEKLTRIWNDIKKDLTIFEINQSKLERQLTEFVNWINADAIGVLEAVTGFGKTFIAIIAIKKMNFNAPNNTTYVVVPNTNLYKDWTDSRRGYIKIYKLRNVKVFVINTYTFDLTKKRCNLLVLDEIHRYAKEESMYFSKALELTECKFILGLSGSLSEEEKEFLENAGLKQFGLITPQEAEDNGWVSRSIIYNFGIEPDKETKEEMERLDNLVKSCYKKFNHDFEVARGCSIGKYKVYKGKTGQQWRELLAKQLNITEVEVMRIASAWNYAIGQRQRILFNYEPKLELSKQILEKINKTSIVFSESIDFVDKLKSKLGKEAECYHSKLKSLVYTNRLMDEILAVKVDMPHTYQLVKTNQFKTYKEIKRLYPMCLRIGEKKMKDMIKERYINKDFKFLLTAHSLDEGANFEDIIVALVASSKGVKRVNTQRSGRALRTSKDKDKLALIINLYLIGTQEEKWLEKRQKGTPSSKIKWITSVDEIEESINDEQYEFIAQ